MMGEPGRTRFLLFATSFIVPEPRGRETASAGANNAKSFSPTHVSVCITPDEGFVPSRAEADSDEVSPVRLSSKLGGGARREGSGKSSCFGRSNSLEENLAVIIMLMRLNFIRRTIEQIA